MKAFLDTSVLVATFLGDHEHHVPSLNLFVRHGKQNTCCGAHSLAEVYSTLTRMPGAVGRDAALLFLQDVARHVTVVSLNGAEYLDAIEQCAQAQLSGGTVYDALFGYCALKAKADHLYTWNAKHFPRLPMQVSRRVKRPDQ